MRFQSGKLGALIIVITLLTTVLAGYCTNVTAEEIEVIDYEYVTDVSGLFDYTETPQYINYNPSTNVTGYAGGGSTSAYSDSGSFADLPQSFVTNPSLITDSTTTNKSGSGNYSNLQAVSSLGSPSRISDYSVGFGSRTVYFTDLTPVDENHQTNIKFTDPDIITYEKVLIVRLTDILTDSIVQSVIDSGESITLKSPSSSRDLFFFYMTSVTSGYYPSTGVNFYTYDLDLSSNAGVELEIYYDDAENQVYYEGIGNDALTSMNNIWVACGGTGYNSSMATYINISYSPVSGTFSLVNPYNAYVSGMFPNELIRDVQAYNLTINFNQNVYYSKLSDWYDDYAGYNRVDLSKTYSSMRLYNNNGTAYVQFSGNAGTVNVAVGSLANYVVSASASGYNQSLAFSWSYSYSYEQIGDLEINNPYVAELDTLFNETTQTHVTDYGLTVTLNTNGTVYFAPNSAWSQVGGVWTLSPGEAYTTLTLYYDGELLVTFGGNGTETTFLGDLRNWNVSASAPSYYQGLGTTWNYQYTIRTGANGPAVVYSQSSQPNNFRYIIEEGSTTTGTYTISSTGSYPETSIPKGDITNFFINYQGTKYNAGSTVTTQGTTYNISANGITTLNSIISELGTLSTYQKAEITLNYGSAPIFFYNGIWKFSEVERGDGYTQYIYSSNFNDDQIPSKFILNIATNLVTAYQGETALYSTNAKNVYVIYGYSDRSSGSFDTGNQTASVGMNITYTAYPTYGYADPSQGVYISPQAILPIEWANGYQNSVIDLVVGINHNSYGKFRVSFPSNTNEVFQFIDLEQFSNNRLQITTGSYNINTQATVSTDDYYPTGNWKGVQLSIDVINGTVGVTLVKSITDYSVPLSDGFSFDLELPDKLTSGVSFLQLASSSHPSGDSYKFGVVNTDVFLNTYNAVMSDPSIDIREYFPNLIQYRLNFYSFALVGDSVTINGNSYPVDRTNNTITVVGADGTETTGTLNNIYISVQHPTIDSQELNTFITFANENKTVNLGETTNQIVEFTGLWYFTTGLYESFPGLETVYNWDLNGEWGLSSAQTLVIFVLVALLGLLICKGVLKLNVKKLDLVIVAFSIVIALVMSEVFI